MDFFFDPGFHWVRKYHADAIINQVWNKVAIIRLLLSGFNVLCHHLGILQEVMLQKLKDISYLNTIGSPRNKTEDDTNFKLCLAVISGRE